MTMLSYLEVGWLHGKVGNKPIISGGRRSDGETDFSVTLLIIRCGKLHQADSKTSILGLSSSPHTLCINTQVRMHRRLSGISFIAPCDSMAMCINVISSEKIFSFSVFLCSCKTLPTPVGWDRLWLPETLRNPLLYKIAFLCSGDFVAPCKEWDQWE